ncbi:MAG: 16S rRNA (uracil(1498)-N(3))-methyltransferase [Micrococcales bacterium]|nr:16S rRNA (uracil(1498)-N(3))-methyltransferase [Micrococcales bacterium]
MTLPLFLVADGALAGLAAGAAYLLDGPEGRHAATVRRIGVGEQVLLADGSGVRVTADVAAADKDALHLRVVAVETEPAPAPRFVLVQALAKGDRDDQAIEAATELGVDEVVPWQSARSIVVWRGDREAKALRKWETTVRAAAKQSRRSRVPIVAPRATTPELARRIRHSALTLVLHEGATEPLAAVQLPAAGDVLVIVGPEGGIAPEELTVLEEAGGRAVRLGDTVLRSSSAGPAALAVLSVATRWR